MIYYQDQIRQEPGQPETDSRPLMPPYLYMQYIQLLFQLYKYIHVSLRGCTDARHAQRWLAAENDLSMSHQLLELFSFLIASRLSASALKTKLGNSVSLAGVIPHSAGASGMIVFSANKE